ncbi:dolichyl-phosphate-mannose synthase (plasmid) [Cylindrospermum sp. NIES-4074]|nr:dolichyl-phosphate-mannose synthase [Cylindrospermum sp. NIES-4074]
MRNFGRLKKFLVVTFKQLPKFLQPHQEINHLMNPYSYIGNLIKRLYLGLSFIPFFRLIRFGIVGLSGVVIDLGIFYFLHHSGNLEITPSAIISTEVAIINNFLWNDLWTFGDLSEEKTSINQRCQRFLKFNLICFLGLMFNTLIVNLLFYKFGVNEYMAKLVAIASVTLWNFWLNLKVNWQASQA